MNRKKIGLIIMAVLLALALVGCAAAAAGAPVSEEASVTPLGTPEDVPDDHAGLPAISVRYLEGEVVYLHESEEQPLTTEVLLYQGDAVKTRSDGMAVLKLDGDKQVQIAPDSHVEISGFVRGADGDRTLLVLHRGNIINILDAPLGEKDSYEVETSTLVMAIRGTIASVSSDAETGRDRVMLFEGGSEVRLRAENIGVEVLAGECAWVLQEQLERRAFTNADLNGNEYWFLYEADYSVLFDEPGARIADRLEPLLEEPHDQQEAEATGAADGAPTPPAVNPPAADPPPEADSPPAEGGGGMDESAFRAIEQEFLQAKEDYNNGSIGKAAFLAIKERYIEAKKLFYGD